MSLSNLYFRGCFERPSEEQKQAVESILGGGVDGDVVDRSCSRADINNCGKSVNQLLEQYPIYDPQRGLYKSWGDIEFPWEISNSTPNLIFNSSNNKWEVAAYESLYSYKENDLVLLIEDYGYVISLYRANQDILAVNRAFDYSKWDKVCQVETTVPAGLPTEAELFERYETYDSSKSLFYSEWGAFSSVWSEGLLEQSISACGPNLTIEELEKCLELKSTDNWGVARIRRERLYKKGDIVLLRGECDDSLCVYVAVADLPATEYVFEQYFGKPFSDFVYLNAEDRADNQKTKIWQMQYCISTGRNRCLEYQRKKEPALGYEVIEIGSKGHYVEAPVPYRLKPNTPTLDEMAQTRVPPRVLSQEEIDSLNQPQEE